MKMKNIKKREKENKVEEEKEDEKKGDITIRLK